MSKAFPRFLFPLVLGLSMGGHFLGAAQAREAGRLFFIPESDGYGVSDCLAGSSACGKVVADSWCEAHGQGAAIAWGKAEDITASIAEASARPRKAGALVVRCGG